MSPPQEACLDCSDCWRCPRAHPPLSTLRIDVIFFLAPTDWPDIMGRARKRGGRDPAAPRTVVKVEGAAGWEGVRRECREAARLREKLAGMRGPVRPCWVGSAGGGGQDGAVRGADAVAAGAPQGGALRLHPCCLSSDSDPSMRKAPPPRTPPAESLLGGGAPPSRLLVAWALVTCLLQVVRGEPSPDLSSDLMPVLGSRPAPVSAERHHHVTIDLMTVITPNLFFESLINSKSFSIFKPLNHSCFSFQGQDLGGGLCALCGGHRPQGRTAGAARPAASVQPRMALAEPAVMCVSRWGQNKAPGAGATAWGPTAAREGLGSGPASPCRPLPKLLFC